MDQTTCAEHAHLERLEADVEGAERAAYAEAAPRTSAFGVAPMASIKETFSRAVFGALDDYEAGSISASEMERRWQSAIRRGFSDAYGVGSAAWGQQPDSGDLAWLRGAIKEEQKFARRFVRQLAEGEASFDGAAARLAMYVDTLESVKTNAWVEKSPPGSVFHWKLGAAEHCASCLILASASPYRKADLPAVPRSGSTPCLSRCACRLILDEERSVTGSAAKRQPRAVRDADALVAGGSGTRPGGREPQPEEREQIDDLRARINYHRRRMEQLPAGAERDAAIRSRKQANSELIDYLDERGIREVPLLDVGEVVGGADVPPKLADELLARGIDGASVTRVAAQAWEAGSRRLRADLERAARRGKK